MRIWPLKAVNEAQPIRRRWLPRENLHLMAESLTAGSEFGASQFGFSTTYTGRADVGHPRPVKAAVRLSSRA